MTKRACLFIDDVYNSSYMRVLDVCPDTGPRGELVFAMVTQAELTQMKSIPDLFGFNADYFGMFVLYFILLFLGGYFTGLIARKLGRH
ncbi:hypothetical protein CE456_12675 [Aeromonas salmonicida]|jgi:hypothetical protein|nr:hypothetical protein CE456_12675 [Aeromonas salmonicida]GAJ51058.1 hypothetical protein ASA01S_165_00040 [Aeromonas salmonicida subsp. masoucida NBRC 13784]ASI27706.1 hypothetical protein CE463_12700 [Aeromonas salmonicida]ASI31837.1 hypothetical protein CE462_11650 [Aeromonas salmonicida]PMU03183.1 hypothetical protein CJI17_21410 [Aeromonas salmonicida]